MRTLETTRALRALPALLAWALAASAAYAEAEASPARVMMEQTVVEVVAILKDPELDSKARRSRIESVAYERFDFSTMSRLVLAKNWRRLSKEQQGDFVVEFKTYLANDYGSRLDRYSQEDSEVVGERAEPRGDVTVKTVILGGDNDGALVDYRMRERKAGWKIIDVVIEGISLVANFRDQFREVISNGGPEALLDKLKEKNGSA